MVWTLTAYNGLTTKYATTTKLTNRYTAVLVPDSLTEVLGEVGLSQYMLYAKRAWHPEREATSESASEEALSRGPFCVFHVAMGVDVKRCHV